MCKILSNLGSLPETSVLMPSNLQIHRQVPLSSTKIIEKTKMCFMNYYEDMKLSSQKIAMIQVTLSSLKCV